MWTVITTDVFNEWFEQQDESTQEKVLAALVVLQQQGPSLGRPLVDTVYDSKFTNMKELRVQHRGRLMCADKNGDFHLGDSKQPTYKSPLPFDLVS